MRPNFESSKVELNPTEFQNLLGCTHWLFSGRFLREGQGEIEKRVLEQGIKHMGGNLEIDDEGVVAMDTEAVIYVVEGLTKVFDVIDDREAFQRNQHGGAATPIVEEWSPYIEKTARELYFGLAGAGLRIEMQQKTSAG